MKQSAHQFHEIFSRVSKCLAYNAEKSITVEDNKKRMNIANCMNIYVYIYKYICIYIYIYIYILYVTRMNHNKNDSINSILQHGYVVDNNCWVVFPASRFSYLMLCSR